MNFASPRPISLANLSSATAQEIFDWITFNLIKQGRKAVTSKGRCKYKTPDGRSCAAGWLMAENEYQSSFEGRGWRRLIEVYPSIVSINHEQLIRRLQEVHDECSLERWHERFAAYAKSFKLKFTYKDMPLGCLSVARTES